MITIPVRGWEDKEISARALISVGLPLNLEIISLVRFVTFTGVSIHSFVLKLIPKRINYKINSSVVILCIFINISTFTNLAYIFLHFTDYFLYFHLYILTKSVLFQCLVYQLKDTDYRDLYCKTLGSLTRQPVKWLFRTNITLASPEILSYGIY